MKRAAILGLALALVTNGALAKPWVVDNARSRLGFTGQQGDETFSGGFRTFRADIDFDPEHPETGKISATIDIASITAGSAERDAYLPQSDWFDTKKFPQALFVSDSITLGALLQPCGGSGSRLYEAKGKLTIKNISNPATLPFCLNPEGDHWRAQGDLSINRADFNIGIGQWAGDSLVRQTVKITVDLLAHPR